MAAGLDSLFGNTVVIVYPNVYIHRTGKMQDLTVRCYHLKCCLVKAGDTVTTATRIGIMGNTGKYGNSPHLHIEMDTDTQYPCYTPGIAKDGAIIERGVDTTINPSWVLHCKVSSPDNQQIYNWGYEGWNSKGDWNIPIIR